MRPTSASPRAGHHHRPNAPPLKLHRDSRLIHKPAARASTSTSSSGHRQPVIIYTHSPKVIQTTPRDFMDIVQSLTGAGAGASVGSAVTAQDEPPSSSESCAAHAHALPCPAAPPPRYIGPPPPQLEIPLFMGGGAPGLVCCASNSGGAVLPPSPSTTCFPADHSPVKLNLDQEHACTRHPAVIGSNPFNFAD